MERKLMLIINPAAGRGGYQYHFCEALHALERGGLRPTLFYTAGRGDATRFTAEHGAEYDVVACIGGDGTLSEVLGGLMVLENRPQLGYIPMGTANDVATTLGLPKNDSLAAALRVMLFISTSTPMVCCFMASICLIVFSFMFLPSVFLVFSLSVVY